MLFQGKDYRAVWIENSKVFMIDQNKLPFIFEIKCCNSSHETCMAIVDMTTRGAGSIGAAAAFAMAQASYEANENRISQLIEAKHMIEATRPTARNLFYAVEKVFKAANISHQHAVDMAMYIADECANHGKQIGLHGNTLIGSKARILTHCNAGWLALVDYGSALAPIYEAQKSNKNPEVFFDETRPRSQGARLTAWELYHQGINHHIIPDNASAHYMSKKMIDICIVGADRIARNGDAANKIGTLEKAVAAAYYGIPFYIAAPSSTYDSNCIDGEAIAIENRNEDEVLYQTGPDDSGSITRVRVANRGSRALNPAFDVTPHHLISGFITEDGIFTAAELKKQYSGL